MVQWQGATWQGYNHVDFKIELNLDAEVDAGEN